MKKTKAIRLQEKEEAKQDMMREWQKFKETIGIKGQGAKGVSNLGVRIVKGLFKTTISIVILIIVISMFK
jgi:hypothetical protein